MSIQRVKKIREILKVLDNLPDSQLEYFLTTQSFTDVKMSIKTKDVKSEVTKEESEKVTDEVIKRKIILLLKAIGMPANIKGYYYIQDAIFMMMNDTQKYIESINNKLYYEIAQKYNTTISCVERNIRHAIEVSCDRGDIDILYEIFGNTVNEMTGKPKNSEAITTLAEYVKIYML